MPKPQRIASIDLPDPDATIALGEALGPVLRTGDTLLLSGGLGAGKTLLARAIVQTLLAAEGRVEEVPSPSFTLVQTYRAGGTEIWHVDLYRIGRSFELDELGVPEAFETAICLVEWPDRLGPYTPNRNLQLRIGEAGTGRRICVEAVGGGWEAVASLLESWQP